MTYSTAELSVILRTFALLSVLLLIGATLRAKVKFFQNFFIPASVIGGLIGLVLGPNGFNIIHISDAMMSVAKALPSLLLIPILCTVTFGTAPMKFGKGALVKQRDIIAITLILTIINFWQIMLGCLVNFVCTALGIDCYELMGMEIVCSFSGSHSMVSMITAPFQEAGLPFWEAAQGVGLTLATFGMISGIAVGIFQINLAARKGYTRAVKSASEISEEYRTGIYKSVDKMPSIGRQSCIASNIETITLYLCIIMVCVGGGYLIQDFVDSLHMEILSAMSTWFYALVLMSILWPLIRKMKIDYLFEEDLKNKIVGPMTDFLVVAAIASIPISAAFEYLIPMAAMAILGIVTTALMTWFFSKRFQKDCWFEKSLGMLGCSTGTFVTGMMMTKMADPDQKTPAMTDFCMGYTLASFIAIPLFAILIAYLMMSGPVKVFWVSTAVTVISLITLLIFDRALKSK